MALYKKFTAVAGLPLACVATAALCLLSSCSGGPATGGSQPAPPDTAGTPPPEIAAGLPPLPDGRIATEIVDTLIPGANYHVKSDNASVTGSDLDLLSAPGATSWGIWQIAAGGNDLQSVEIQVDILNDHSYWVARSNYTAGGWDILGPYNADKLFGLISGTNVSPGGNCYIAVITSGGDSATVERLIVSMDRQGWQIVTVDNDADTGAYSSLALVNGNPAISYQAHEGGTVSQRYVRSTSPTGAAPADWSEVVILDTTENVHHTFGDNSLAEVGGNPAISYSLYHHDTGMRDLNYIRSATPSGSQAADWSAPVAVAGDTVGQFNALAEVDGNPAICYFDVDEDGDNYHHRIKYVRSATSAGTDPGDWTELVTLDTETRSGGILDTGWQITLALVNGNPAVSYTQGFFDNGVKYIRSATPTGASPLDWPAPVTVDATSMFTYSSLAEVDGNPALCYYDSTGGALNYARSTTAEGGDAGDWTQKVTINDMGSPGQFSCLAVIGGYPAVSYLGNPDLHFVRSTGATGGTPGDWLAVPDVVDTEGAGWYTSLAEVDGKPAISYYNVSTKKLKYAILFE